MLIVNLNQSRTIQEDSLSEELIVQIRLACGLVWIILIILREVC